MHWGVLFGLLSWSLWCKRNEWIFGDHNRSSEPVLQHSLRMQREVVSAFPPLVAGRSTMDNENVLPVVVVHWLKPLWGWCKLNADGVVAHRSRMAVCGGVVRDEEGNWLIKFFRKLSVCSILKAELWGLYESLLAG
ncbi:hypothetical protein V6N12_064266 [Hibiscus sabdariffa]|uniref:RNase H type-1 domain-containing protein n=1 Tax=Hibiscus sabdariffa TaxID=183260 RepID=A0ABR2G5C3_9ROSI